MEKARGKLHGISQEAEIKVNLVDNIVEVNGKQHNIDDLSWDVPVCGTVYGTLLNYKGALAALGNAVNENPYKEKPKAPILYIKPRNTIIGCNMPIPLPADATELEVGAALGIVIGHAAARVSEEAAFEYVSGYTIVNDISIPHESVFRPAIRQKARDGFCPIGPWIMQRDAVSDVNALNIRVYINGRLHQENNTRNLIRSIARLISDITEFMTLNKGDILLVGVPENAPLAKAGDHIRIEIEGIGSLENEIVHEHALPIGGI
ncbi:fumarylacetoacetate hydrolase family protein [Bacillus safensis]|uniref:fumarylacetoacetate hydrolase family protein n=1 Tax=Bacillus safensis TaxID=561879 RepID=UPI000B430D7E|nr:fumarylacetoacetate hydrolase family protein [Bacillus safensis]MCY7493671.1 fumarylacetoacetate hydrolase family protein [Bacillus safensis]MED4993114.1 fumarylacetoacetate hydrolase family protein [Bacillus safensis]UDB46005.1 fumarylacetoacetate hydrolase family protein [Bacillus safensis]